MLLFFWSLQDLRVTNLPSSAAVRRTNTVTEENAAYRPVHILAGSELRKQYLIRTLQFRLVRRLTLYCLYSQKRFYKTSFSGTGCPIFFARSIQITYNMNIWAGKNDRKKQPEVNSEIRRFKMKQYISFLKAEHLNQRPHRFLRSQWFRSLVSYLKYDSHLKVFLTSFCQKKWDYN